MRGGDMLQTVPKETMNAISAETWPPVKNKKGID